MIARGAPMEGLCISFFILKLSKDLTLNSKLHNLQGQVNGVIADSSVKGVDDPPRHKTEHLSNGHANQIEVEGKPMMK